MDDLGFGGPYQAPPVRAETAEPSIAPARSRTLPTGKVMVGAILGVVVALGAFYFLVLADKGGKAVAAQNQQALDTAGQANDLDAETSLRQVAPVVAAAEVEAGSFSALTPQELENYEPSLTWTGGASTGPEIVSVASTDTAFAAAALSDSGTCLWLKQNASGATTYGSGQPCTGKAAMAASAASW